MPLTPADVHNVAFSKPPIGKRGYNEDEVDQFLDLVEDALGELQDENADLRVKVEQLEQELEDASSGVAPAFAPVATDSAAEVDEDRIRESIEAEVRADYERRLDEAARLREEAEDRVRDAEDRAAEAEARAEAASREPRTDADAQPQGLVSAPAQSGESATADTHMQAARVLGLAQEMADRLTSDAKRESDEMLSLARSNAESTVADADSRSEETLANARREADETLANARREADETLADARQRSEQMLSEAKTESETTLNDARQRPEQMISDADARPRRPSPPPDKAELQ